CFNPGWRHSDKLMAILEKNSRTVYNAYAITSNTADWQQHPAREENKPNTLMTSEPETKKVTKEISPALSIGSIVEGKVVARDRSSLFIDLGPQGTGIIYG